MKTAKQCVKPFRVEVFYPTQSPKKTQTFHEKQTQVLQEYGIDNVTSASNNWGNQENCICIVLYDQAGTMIAGTRIEVADPRWTLPLEKAIKKESPETLTYIHQQEGYLAELCAAWVCTSHRKQGCTELLVEKALQVSKQRQLKELLIFTSQYTAPIVKSFGFKALKNARGVSTYCYPDERYSSTLMQLDLSVVEHSMFAEVQS